MNFRTLRKKAKCIELGVLPNKSPETGPPLYQKFKASTIMLRALLRWILCLFFCESSGFILRNHSPRGSGIGKKDGAVHGTRGKEMDLATKLEKGVLVRKTLWISPAHHFEYDRTLQGLCWSKLFLLGQVDLPGAGHSS